MEPGRWRSSTAVTWLKTFWRDRMTDDTLPLDLSSCRSTKRWTGEGNRKTVLSKPRYILGKNYFSLFVTLALQATYSSASANPGQPPYAFLCPTH